MSEPRRRATPVDVLLARGLPAQAVRLLDAGFDGLEAVAASLSHHDGGICGDPDRPPCPWHPPGPLADRRSAIVAAVDAWSAEGWLERGLLSPDHGVRPDARITAPHDR